MAKKTLKNKPAEKAGKDANTTSVKKSSTKLTITQKYEYLDRVSAFALYTNSTIVKRTDDTTTFRMPITITRSSKKEVTNIELELCAAPDIDFSNVPLKKRARSSSRTYAMLSALEENITPSRSLQHMVTSIPIMARV